MGQESLQLCSRNQQCSYFSGSRIIHWTKTKLWTENTIFEVPFERFRIMTSSVCTNLANRTILVLLPFSTTYLCERNFSAIAANKVKKLENLKTVQEEQSIFLWSVPAHIQKLYSQSRANLRWLKINRKKNLYLIPMYISKFKLLNNLSLEEQSFNTA